MADVLGTIGRLARPVEGLLDTLLPGGQPPPQRPQGLGDLLRTAVGGVGDFVENGVLGAARGVTGALNPSSDLSGRDRLLLGGGAALGLALGGREAYRSWREAQVPAVYAARSGYTQLVAHGERARYVPGREGLDTQARWPGLPERQAQQLGSIDLDGFMHGFRRFDPTDAASDQQTRFWLQRYADEHAQGDQRTAQFDLAKFDHAIDRSIISDPKLKRAWRALTDGGSLSEEAGQDALRAAAELARVTENLDFDLTVGYVGRVTRAEFTDAGLALTVSRPKWWGTPLGSSRRRIYGVSTADQHDLGINVRAFAGEMERNLTRLAKRGIKEIDSVRAGEAPTFRRSMEAGLEWYGRARADVAREFGLPDDMDNGQLQRKVAAVSFMSEAEDWDTNIAKARRVLQSPLVVEAEADPRFLEWLRNPSISIPKAEKQAYSRRVDEIHKELTREIDGKGLAVKRQDVPVILRLLGTESIPEIFASGDRQKQRHFYLNIISPDLEDPVTVDRHALSAALGLYLGGDARASEVAERTGDRWYEVVAQVYRRVAENLSADPEIGMELKPNQVQAVIWELWRALKEDPYLDPDTKGWIRKDAGGRVPSGRDVFRLAREDGSENLLFRVLNGEDVDPARPGPFPASALDTVGLGEGDHRITLPAGQVVPVTSLSDPLTVHRYRDWYPAAQTPDGMNVWAARRAQRVSNATRVMSLERTRVGQAELRPGTDHPALSVNDTIEFTLPDGAARPRGAVESGRAQRAGTELSRDRLRPEDLDPEIFTDPDRSPLVTHRWAVISAERGGNAVARHNQLRQGLIDKGYHPIEVEGVYDGVAEGSVLAFGIGPDEAHALGERFEQHSVLTNDGFIYGQTSRLEGGIPAGSIKPMEGLTFHRPDEVPDDYRSVLEVGGQRVGFTADFDWSRGADYLEDRDIEVGTLRSVRKVRMEVPPGIDPSDLIAEIEQKGGTDLAIYSRLGEIPGFVRATEVLFTDGQQTVASRIAGSAPALPNGFPVWVRSADGLPVEPPQVGTPRGNILGRGDWGTFTASDLPPESNTWGWSAGTLTADAEAAVTVRQLGPHRVEVKMADPSSDVTEALDARDSLQAVGFEVDLAIGDRVVPSVKVTAERPTIIGPGGITTQQPRNDLSAPGWVERYGLKFDHGWREGSKSRHLDDEMLQAAEQVMDRFMPEFGDSILRVRPKGIVVSKITDVDVKDSANALAFYSSESRQIVLNQEYWRDPDALALTLRDDRSRGWWSPNVSNHASSLIAHELGHMVHHAIQLHQGGNGKPFNRQLGQILKKHGGRKAVKAQVGRYGAKNIDELLAESFAQHLARVPGSTMTPVARDVIALVKSVLPETVRARKLA